MPPQKSTSLCISGGQSGQGVRGLRRTPHAAGALYPVGFPADQAGNQRKVLNPGDKPEVCFALCEGDQVEAVYAYCNLHSLWKA